MGKMSSDKASGKEASCIMCHREALFYVPLCLHLLCQICTEKSMTSCPACNGDPGKAPMKKLSLQESRTKLLTKNKEKVLIDMVAEAPGGTAPAKPKPKRKCRSVELIIDTTKEVPKELDVWNILVESLANETRPAAGSKRKNNSQNSRQHFDASQPSSSIASSAGPCLDRAPEKGKDSKFKVSKPSRSFATKSCHSCAEPSHKKKRVDHLKTSKPHVEALKPSSSAFSIEPCVKPASDKGRGKSLKTTKLQVDPPKPQLAPQEHESALPKPKSPKNKLHTANASSPNARYPIWCHLIASDDKEGGSPALGQIAPSYIRIKPKDGEPRKISHIHGHLKLKLGLASENEVFIRCLGVEMPPWETLDYVLDFWVPRREAYESKMVAAGSSAEELMLPLHYARSLSESSGY